MPKYRNELKIGFVCFLGLLGAAPSAQAATVTPITNFGANPTGIGMYLYTPSNVVAKPPILVGIHACHGKGLDVCTSNHPFAQQADKYGFLMICPSAVSSDGCWDVHSMADLSHNGGGDAAGIISMVNYVVQNNNGDANRVYAAGHSSGGMMTNVLLGSYPDVFKAGAAFAGVPFACFAQGSVDSLGWSSTCATGQVTMSGAQWGSLVRAADPGFAGTRPRIQLWHGTVDDTLAFHNFGEEIKEWTNVLGVSETPTTTENNAVQSTWIRTRYADSKGVVQVEAIQETGQPHNLVINGAEAIHFLGLDGSTPITVMGSGGAGGSAGSGGAPASQGGGGSAGIKGSAGTTGAAGSTSTTGTAGSTSTTGAAGSAAMTGTAGSGTVGGADSGTETGGALGAFAGMSSYSAGAPAGGSSGALPANAGSESSTDKTNSSGCAFTPQAADRFPTANLGALIGLLVIGWRRRQKSARAHGAE